jgi:hypothetical protein
MTIHLSQARADLDYPKPHILTSLSLELDGLRAIN